MKDKIPSILTKQDYALLAENQRKLADYIKTSLWDEKMNLLREYWLWERKGVAPQTEHYYK